MLFHSGISFQGLKLHRQAIVVRIANIYNNLHIHQAFSDSPASRSIVKSVMMMPDPKTFASNSRLIITKIVVVHTITEHFTVFLAV